ncbi:hypothetical protein BKA93DRAFT_204429 [Sparassis latifolia]
MGDTHSIFKNNWSSQAIRCSCFLAADIPALRHPSLEQRGWWFEIPISSILRLSHTAGATVLC